MAYPQRRTRPGSLAAAVLPILALLPLSVTPIYAQHMYLDTNMDGVSSSADIVRPSGNTTVDVYLRTNANRAGEPATCNVDDSYPMSIYSYIVALRADGGTVQWQPFSNFMPFPVSLAAGSSPTELLVGFGSNTALAPGTYKLGRVELTVASGAPRLVIAPTTNFNSSDWTSFGSLCLGSEFDNVLKLGIDWFDADGAGNPSNQPPVLSPISDMQVVQGTVATQTITATDPEGDSVELTKALGKYYVTVSIDGSAGGTTTGTIRVAPPFLELYYAGKDTAAISASDGVLAMIDTFTITLIPPSSPPVPNAGGPYAGVVGQPILFDGSASTDPDGDALDYLWTFGDGAEGSGVRPEHTYQTPSGYLVWVTVDDGFYRRAANTYATITDEVGARAFTLGSARSVPITDAAQAYLTVLLEPIGGAYRNEDADLASIVMRFDGSGAVDEIHAGAGKQVTRGDRDRNGIDELALRFGRDDLAALFSGARGRTEVTVTIEGSLRSAAHIRASLTLSVVATGGIQPARVYPNPVNPSGTLGIMIDIAGPLKVELFDINGRLVRILVQESWSPAGYRDVPIDGKDGKGAPLASGVYFYRMKSTKGAVTGRLTIAR